MLQTTPAGFIKAISAHLAVTILLPGDAAVRKKQRATAAFFLVAQAPPRPTSS